MANIESINPVTTPRTIPDTENENGNFMFRPVKYLREAIIDLSLEGAANLIGKAAIITGLALSILVLGAGLYLIYKSMEEWKRQEKLQIKAHDEPANTRSFKEQNNVQINNPKEILKNENEQNILVLGRSRSGKSTLVDVLKDICKVAPESSLFYSTKEPVLHPPINIDPYQLNVIDTPGLFEFAEVGKESRSNDEIIESIKSVAQKHFGGHAFENVDTVIMTISVNRGINKSDIESLNIFLPKLDPKTKKILLITHAENMSDDSRKKLVNQIPDYPVLGQLVNDHFRGKENILFFGSLDKTNTQFASSLNTSLPQIFEYRERLIEELIPKEEGLKQKKIRKAEAKKQIINFYKQAVETEKQTTTSTIFKPTLQINLNMETGQS